MAASLNDEEVNIKLDLFRAGALALWLWEETHVPKVASSNPGSIY